MQGTDQNANGTGQHGMQMADADQDKKAAAESKHEKMEQMRKEHREKMEQMRKDHREKMKEMRKEHHDEMMKAKEDKKEEKKEDATKTQ
jgi:hypothetical protein